jgi:flagellar L-ring protein FlgH
MNNIYKRLRLGGLATLAALGIVPCNQTSAQQSSLLQSQPMVIARQAAPPMIDPQEGVPMIQGQLPTPTLAIPQLDPNEAYRPQSENPVYLTGASWTHQPAPPTRVFRKQDIITIRVDEVTRMQAQGNSDVRKRSQTETLLSDWIRLEDFNLRPDPQGNGDPTIAAESNNLFRAESRIQSREALTFSIAAKIVDIRPNGTLLLEARKSIRMNDNLWETSLTGLCRIDDIAPDNTVLSRDMIDLEISKQDEGHLRDGYRRGWFQRWLDRVQPF